jgi:hypothetical protein
MIEFSMNWDGYNIKLLEESAVLAGDEPIISMQSI